MRSECLPIGKVPHTSALFTHYLNDFSRVSRFYSQPPFDRQWWKKQAASLDYPADRRRQVAGILEKQNQSWKSSAAAMANIARLREGAAAVVTGQQVVLFGGQFMAVLKALTAVKLAAEATAVGAPAVPIFWLATEDHDVAEVSTVKFFGESYELRSLTLAAMHEEGRQAGGVALGPGIEPLLKELGAALKSPEMEQLLRECYRPQATFGEAFARLFARLFADFGLVLMDNSDAALHRLAEPIYSAAVARAEELNAALLERNRELDDAGYHAQVKITRTSTLLFAQHKGVRTVVHRTSTPNGNGFTIGERKLSATELGQEAARHPENFSANALLRPVVQDFLLPTVAYVGGPAETAYFAQSAVVYQRLLGRVTPIISRASATLVEPKIARWIERYGISAADAFRSEDGLRQLAGAKSLPAELEKTFAGARQHIEEAGAPLKPALQELDPTLVAAAERALAKMRYQIESLERRAVRAELRRNEELDRQTAQLSRALHPHGNLQEREIAGVFILARHGPRFLKELDAVLDTRCAGHQVIFL